MLWTHGTCVCNVASVVLPSDYPALLHSLYSSFLAVMYCPVCKKVNFITPISLTATDVIDTDIEKKMKTAIQRPMEASFLCPKGLKQEKETAIYQKWNMREITFIGFSHFLKLLSHSFKPTRNWDGYWNLERWFLHLSPYKKIFLKLRVETRHGNCDF